eukprot:1893293-Prorocentrum_lima.AAC.1
MTSSLVGSEMCIRDSSYSACEAATFCAAADIAAAAAGAGAGAETYDEACLLYTSDAADDM